MKRFLMTIAVMMMAAGAARAQTAESNYQVVENWAKFPEGVTAWSAATGVDIDSKGNIYVFHRNESMPIMAFDDDDEAFRLAADTPYGLGASLYTSSPTRVERAYRELRVGTVWVNDPVVEERLRKWAAAFARWSDGGKKRAFLAPLQEMNGGWVRYGTDPANFKLAWLKIQRVFKEEGVAENAVSWVFAPNGWAEPGHEFENYYPGDSVVDVIAFSTLNFGGCPEYGSNWDTFELVFEPYLDRLHAMAPGKPIFLAQTSTVGVDANGRQNDKLKNEWLRDTYAKLAAYPGVRAVIYYNLVKSEPSVIKCRPIDWRIFDKHGKIAYEGFLDAARSPRFDYWAPDSQEMVTTAFGGQPQAFYSDVWPAHPFSGSDDPWYFSWVDALQKSGVAIGCRTETALVMNTPHEFYYYCPESLVTRAEMAMFLELAMRGGEFRPPGAGGSFSDVPAEHWAVGWIEQLAADGITSGCVEGKFCPENPVTRAEMALFVGRAKHWPEAFEPLPASGGLFEDVPADRWGAAWVEQLAVEGITAGCKPRLFCPDDHVTRSQLALFLVRAFALTDR